MEEERKRKIFMLRAGTTIVAVLLLFLWIANLKNVWRASGNEAPSPDAEQWADFREELDKSLSDIQEKLDRRNVATTSPATSTPPAQADDGQQLLLEGILEETLENAATSATSASVRKQPSCPEWINCMPTIVGPGESQRSCAVPPGCEGITQIAY